MKKIAILTCLRANDVCAGCGCLNAFYDRKRHFDRYADEEIRLTAFMRCSRCLREGGDPMDDAGFVEKLERLIAEGTEVVQLYIRDMVGSIARPVQELKGFERISLKPGESRLVSFKITPDLLKFYNKDLNYVCEPGDFEVMVGPNSRDVQRLPFTLR